MTGSETTHPLKADDGGKRAVQGWPQCKQDSDVFRYHQRLVGVDDTAGYASGDACAYSDARARQAPNVRAG